MTRSPWMALYFEDFFSDEKVQLMSNEAVGCYVALLRHAWREGSIPDNPGLLLVLSRCRDRQELDRVWPAVSRCFVPAEPGRLVNPRQERERQKMMEISEANKKAINTRWERERAKKGKG